MSETLVLGASGVKVESIERQLERIDKEIEAVERKKLITLVLPGGTDKVLYVQPYDLRGKDPEEDVEIMESYVIETKWDNGFAQHITGIRQTGKMRKRGPSGPFGPTYKIDSGNQNGERELNEFKRVLETHCNRLTKVPEPAAYHTEVNELGHADLRNITLKKEDVPVAFLEHYEPLEDLKHQREILRGKAGEKATITVGATDIKCPDCDFKTPSRQLLALHTAKKHTGEEL